MKKIVVLSGAGISAESGINTFRDTDGLWEGHDVMEVASPEGWYKNKKLVLDFYNQRRKQLNEVLPNDGHKCIASLEKYFDVTVVTQNVDNLHERAGSSHIVHIHGQLTRKRSELNEDIAEDIHDDILLGDRAPDGAQWRPDIVWFGEQVPLLDTALQLVMKADIIIIVGTSLQVYPAAGLVGYASPNAIIFYIDPNPKSNHELSRSKNLKIIPKVATLGMQEVYRELVNINK